MTREELKEYNTYGRVIDWDAEVARLSDVVSDSPPDWPCVVEVLCSEEPLFRNIIGRMPQSLAARIQFRVV